MGNQQTGYWFNFPLENGGVLQVSTPAHLDKKDLRRFKRWWKTIAEGIAEKPPAPAAADGDKL